MNIPAFLTGKPALVGLTALAVVAGVGAGWAATSSAGTMAQPTGRAAVTGYACPGRDPVTTLHGNDRVLALGRDATGAWVQLRDPVHPDARVWIQAGQASPDHGQFAALPVVSAGALCPHVVPTGAAPATSPPVASPGPESPTAGTPAAATSAARVPGAGRTTAPPTGGRTTPPSSPPADTTGPAITGVTAAPVDIWENYPAAGGRCSSQVSSTISARVTDPSGIAEVGMAWSFPGHSGSAAMAGTGTARATLGGFAYPSVPDNQVVSVAITVTATDRAGNRSTAKLTVHLHSASECLG